MTDVLDRIRRRAGRSEDARGAGSPRPNILQQLSRQDHPRSEAIDLLLSEEYRTRRHGTDRGRPAAPQSSCPWKDVEGFEFRLPQPSLDR